MNEHLYLDTEANVLRVSMKSGVLMDPQDDPNPATRVCAGWWNVGDAYLKRKRKTMKSMKSDMNAKSGLMYEKYKYLDFEDDK